MSGTRDGALRARDKNLERDPDFYRNIGRVGGSACVIKGFGANRALAREAGRKGGLKRLENLRRKQNED